MKRNRLGKSGLVVTDICLGTMTFGLQADEATSFAIMDRAVEAGVDFFDTAEMYPVPPSAELFGVTEEIVGRWLKSRGMRDRVIVATKVTGPGHGWFRPPIRHGFTALDRRQIHRACDDSLRRLGTDFIDLYQTHWPDHGMRAEETLEEQMIADYHSEVGIPAMLLAQGDYARGILSQDQLTRFADAAERLLGELDPVVAEELAEAHAGPSFAEPGQIRYHGRHRHSGGRFDG